MTPSTDADRTIVVSHVVRAPRTRVWGALSDAAHLDAWWGPDGFTNVTSTFDFREGGAWTYLMRGPDGTEYPNWIGYRRILPPERIEYRHGTAPDDPDAFDASITLEEHEDGTQVTLRTVFATQAARDHVVREFGAIEGGQQTLAKLAAYVEAPLR